MSWASKWLRKPLGEGKIGGTQVIGKDLQKGWTKNQDTTKWVALAVALYFGGPAALKALGIGGGGTGAAGAGAAGAGGAGAAGAGAGAAGGMSKFVAAGQIISGLGTYLGNIENAKATREAARIGGEASMAALDLQRPFYESGARMLPYQEEMAKEAYGLYPEMVKWAKDPSQSPYTTSQLEQTNMALKKFLNATGDLDSGVMDELTRRNTRDIIGKAQNDKWNMLSNLFQKGAGMSPVDTAYSAGSNMGDILGQYGTNQGNLAKEQGKNTAQTYQDLFDLPGYGIAEWLKTNQYNKRIAA